LIYYAFLSDFTAPVAFNTLLRTFCPHKSAIFYDDGILLTCRH